MIRVRLALLSAAVAAFGCAKPDQSSTPSTAAKSTVADSAGGTVDLAQAPSHFTPLPSNHAGKIPVLEYHLIADHDALYSRTRETFRKELQLMYDRGYRPITMAQMLDKDFRDVPAGMSPVVYTFDDASPSQFSYSDSAGTVIDPQSGLGIWLDFAKTHPDWKGKAVFCMLNGGADGHNFFGDSPKYGGQHSAWRFKKVKWLADNGFELCDHTLWHAQLNKYSDAVVQEQIGRNLMGIDSAVPGYHVRTFALPQGLWPKDSVLAFRGSYTDPKSKKTVSYAFDAVLQVAGGPAMGPYDPRFLSTKWQSHVVNRIEMNGTQLINALDQLDKTKSRFVP